MNFSDSEKNLIQRLIDSKHRRSPEAFNAEEVALLPALINKQIVAETAIHFQYYDNVPTAADQIISVGPLTPMGVDIWRSQQ